MELYLILDSLRAILFNDQPLLSGQLSKPFCAALIPTLQSVCSGLYVCKRYLPSVTALLIMSTQFIQRHNDYFDLPREGDPLHLDQSFTEARNLLDECFRQTIAGPSSIAIHLAFEMGFMPKSLGAIQDICKTPDRQCLRRVVDEHPCLVRIHEKVADKYVLEYYVLDWMRDFFFNPNRCRYLYSTSLVIHKCLKAIESLLVDPTPDSHNDPGLVYFFTPMPTPSGEAPNGNIANATRLLKSATNGSDRHELLLSLEYLSEIHWFDIYNRSRGQRHLTNIIVHWVCTTLVGCFLLARFHNPLTAIQSRSHHHWSLVIFEMKCTSFLPRSFPAGSFQRLANVFHGPANWAFLKINIVLGVCYKIFPKRCWMSMVLRCYLRSFQC